MIAILITVDQRVRPVEIDGYEGLRSHFNGYPETVKPRRLDQPFCMLVDDAGKLKGLPVNEFASWLYEADRHGSYIVGDAFIMKQEWGEDGYDLVGLDAPDIHQIVKKYGLKPV